MHGRCTLLSQRKTRKANTRPRNHAAYVSARKVVYPAGDSVEHAIEDSYAFHKFVQVDFIGDEQAPDATTPTKFCRSLHEDGLAKL